MSYQLLTHHNAACYSPGREGRSILYIIVHHWDDPARRPTFDGVIAWFKNRMSGVSAHYVVEAGRVACLVNESDTAYHAGNWAMNTQSIGIECNPRCSSGDLATVRELIADLQKRYPGAKVITHRDVVPTSCPGEYARHIDYLRTGGTPAPKPKTSNRPAIAVDGIVGRQTVTAWQRLMGTPADGVISSQYSGNREYFPAFNADCIQWENDPDGSTFIAALQKRLGVTADGVAGPVTITALQKRLGVTADGYFGAQTARALQRKINEGKVF